jgi:hypothetical protein
MGGRRLKKASRTEIDQFIARLTLLKEEAMRIGMYRTGQKLEEPIRQAGWELADLIEHGDIEQTP